MQREFKRLQQGTETVSTLQLSVCCGFWALLFGVDAANLSTPSAPTQEPKCFSVHVRLNGSPIESPRTITLKSKQIESNASLEEGCFKVPPDMLREKALDV